MAGWNIRISINSTTVRPYRCLSRHNQFSSSLSKLAILAIRVCYVKEFLPTIMEPQQEVNRTCLIRGFPRTIGSTCGMRLITNINRNTQEVWTVWQATGRRLRAPVWATWDTRQPPTDIRPRPSSMPVASFKQPLSIIKVVSSTDRTVRLSSNLRYITSKCTASTRICRRSNRSIHSSNRSISICRRSNSI